MRGGPSRCFEQLLIWNWKYFTSGTPVTEVGETVRGRPAAWPA
jgi:hypothetical protein